MVYMIPHSFYFKYPPMDLGIAPPYEQSNTSVDLSEDTGSYWGSYLSYCVGASRTLRLVPRLGLRILGRKPWGSLFAIGKTSAPRVSRSPNNTSRMETHCPTIYWGCCWPRAVYQHYSWKSWPIWAGWTLYLTFPALAVDWACCRTSHS